jgi:hypothetical protein
MRRLLCLAMLLACNRPELSPSGSEAKPMSPTSSPPSSPGTPPTRVSELAPRRGASRLAVAKDRIGFLAADRVVVTSLGTKQQVATPIADAHAFGVLGDDLAVATNTLGKTGLVRFGAGDPKGRRLEGVMSVPNTGYGSIFAAAKPTELYLGGPQIGLARCRIDPDRIVPIEAIDWTMEEEATFTAAGQGRVAFVQRDAIVRLGPDAARASFHLPGPWGTPTHLAAGPNAETMWATDRDQLGLITLDHDQARVTKTVALGALAYAVASAADFVAVVLTDGPAAQFTTELVVVGADGTIRWRAKLPPNNPNIQIAASADQVAVQVGDALLAWKAKDGAALLP